MMAHFKKAEHNKQDTRAIGQCYHLFILNVISSKITMISIKFGTGDTLILEQDHRLLFTLICLSI